jgi:hypothetical protein
MATNPVIPEAPVLDDKKISSPLEQWNNGYALAVAKANFSEMETFRSGSHDGRWNNADQLNLMWAPPRVWEGTQSPAQLTGHRSDQPTGGSDASISHGRHLPHRGQLRVSPPPGIDAS